MSYYKVAYDLLESSRFQFSNLKPSEWAEKNRFMTSQVSAFEGKFSYDLTPYLREIVDILHYDSPIHTVAVEKGAQLGFSACVIENGIGWIIAESPGPTIFSAGHQDLVKQAMTLRIDQMIDSSGIRKLIRPNAVRKKNTKTGDTDFQKEFPGGHLIGFSISNHKLLRQTSAKYGFLDDYEANKGESEQSGDTDDLIEQRFASFGPRRKVFKISTPEVLQTSNIHPVYLKGDQRKYMVPCPCCSAFIELQWAVPVQGDKKNMGGISWKTDTAGLVIPSSVGYICQECGGFFKETHKYEMNKAGFWKPTATPYKEGYASYHISALYAPPGMFNWYHYVVQYLEAYPPGQEPNERKAQTFQNLVLGLPYEKKGISLKASELQKNQRNYEIGIIPEKLSIKDGNGIICLLTCACDMNGTENDARLDWEILAHSATGSTYSIDHGSIGTFVYREGEQKIKEDRARWTYEHHRPNSVWKELNSIVGKMYKTDTGRQMKIFITGLDCGHYTNHAYTFLDTTNHRVVGLKGKDIDKAVSENADVAHFKPAVERLKLFLVEVSRVKDSLAAAINLKFDPHNDTEQPPGFMNFPYSVGEKYQYKNFFSHYEAEERIPETKGQKVSIVWKKKNSNVQNHFWDVRVYNTVLRDIAMHLIGKDVKKKIEYPDYVEMIIALNNKQANDESSSADTR